jgi:hypothetical protein
MTSERPWGRRGPSLNAIADMVRAGDTEEAVAALVDLDRYIERWMMESWIVASETWQKFEYEPRYYMAVTTVARTMAYAIREGENPPTRTEQAQAAAKLHKLIERQMPTTIDAEQIENLLRGAGVPSEPTSDEG